MWLAWLLAGGVMATPLHEIDVQAQVAARAQELGRGILPPGASPRVALPVPARWPPAGPTELVFHVYAVGFDPSLRDGEIVLSTWALATLTPGASVADVRPLRRPTRELGVQGVRPLRAEERAALARRATAESALRRLAREGRTPGGADADEVRRYACAWLAMNGTIAAELKASVPAYFAWLACP
jgi:hypothetical protein